MASPSGYSYDLTQSSEQFMDMQGQSVTVSSTSLVGFKTANLKSEKGIIGFDVVIDTAAMSAVSMMESYNTDLNLKGKKFRMSIKPNGKVDSYGDASTIEFSAGSSGSSDVAALFADILPTFAKKDAKPDEIWASTDTSNINSKTSQVVSITKSTNTFVGFVTMDGRKCAQINTIVEGTRNAKMNNQGMDLTMSIPFKGTETIWFDTTEGVLVKYESSVKGDGTIELTSMAMTIPISMTATTLLELKK